MTPKRLEMTLRADDLTELRDTCYEVLMALCAGAIHEQFVMDPLQAEIDPAALLRVLNVWADAHNAKAILQRKRKPGEPGRPSHMSIEEVIAMADVYEEAAEEARADKEYLTNV